MRAWTPLQLNCSDTQFKITVYSTTVQSINPLNAKLNPICPLLALFGAHHILHVSRVRVKLNSNHTTDAHRVPDYYQSDSLQLSLPVSLKCCTICSTSTAKLRPLQTDLTGNLSGSQRKWWGI